MVPGGPAALLTHALKEEVDTALKVGGAFSWWAGPDVCDPPVVL